MSEYKSNKPHICPRCENKLDRKTYHCEIPIEELYPTGAGTFFDIHYICNNCDLQGAMVYDPIEIKFDEQGIVANYEALFASHEIDDVLLSDVIPEDEEVLKCREVYQRNKNNEEQN